MMETRNTYFEVASDNEVIQNIAVQIPEILTALGISSVILFESGLKIDTKQYGNTISTVNATPGAWRSFKKEFPVEDIKALFDNIRVVVFYEWENITNASDLWDGFLHEVIKPLAGKNREFIFKLGDTASSRIFDVDEILDIISNYSLHGHVSLVLDENEAAVLYRLLNGMSRSVSVTKQGWITSRNNYFSIYQTMHIDQMLICLADSVLVYRRDRQVELSGIVMANKEAVVQFAINYNTLK